MLRLAFGQLRNRFARYLSLFFAVFAAVGLTVGTVAIVQSLQATVSGLFDKPYAGVTQVAQVRSSQPFTVPEGAVFDQQLSTVVREEGSLYRTVNVRSIEDGPLQWRAIVEGRLPHGPGEVAVSDDTALGQVFELKQGTVTVVGRVEQSAQEQLNGGSSLFADAATVREWAGPNSVGELRSTAPITKAPGLTDIKTSAAHTKALSDKYLAGRAQYFLLLTAFMAVVAVVAMLVIFSSYSVIAAERQREFALLRAVGASGLQLQGSALVEAVILGAIAGVLGAPAGLWVAGWAGRNAADFGIRVPLDQVTLEPVWAVGIVLMGVLACALSAVPAAAGAIRKPLVASLSASAPRASRLGTALMLLLGAALLAVGWYAMGITGLSARRGLAVAIGAAGLIVFGAIALMAVIIPWLIFQLSRPLSAVPTLQLGMAFVGRQRLRAGALVAIVLAGAALVAAVFSGQQHIETYLLGKATNKGAVDVAVRALDGTAEASLVDALLATPGVAGGVSPHAVPVTSGDFTDTVLALSSEEGASVLRGPVTGAAPGELVLAANSPLRGTLSEGKTATVTLKGLPFDVKVRYSDGLESFVDPGVVPQLPVELPRPFVLLRTVGDVDQPADSAVVGNLRGVAAGAGEEVSFQEAFSARENIAEMAGRVLSLSTLMSVVAVLVALIGAVNTLLLMIRERRHDMTLLSAIGVTAPGRVLISAVELLFLAVPALIAGCYLGSWLGSWIAQVVTGV